MTTENAIEAVENVRGPVLVLLFSRTFEVKKRKQICVTMHGDYVEKSKYVSQTVKGYVNCFISRPKTF